MKAEKEFCEGNEKKEEDDEGLQRNFFKKKSEDL